MPSHRVRLSDLKKRRQDRFDLLCEVIPEFLSSGVLGSAEDREVFFDDVALHAAVDAYFLISEAYKAERLQPGHLTEPPKIAAISALVFADFKPVRVKDPAKPLQHPHSINANALLSLYWAAMVFDQKLSPLFQSNFGADSLARYCRILRSIELTSIAAFKADIARGEVQPAYDVLLDHDGTGHASPLSDLPRIDTMILIFELMWDRHGLFED